MSYVIHARLDETAQQLLERLRRQTGLNDSALVRRGLEVLASMTPKSGGRMPVGLGQFESGLPDLGSNPDHLNGFGE